MLYEVITAIAALESRRSLLGDEIVDVALVSMREKLASKRGGISASREPQQRKQITVLFADISGFTAMAETMDHEIVNEVINLLWFRVDKAIVITSYSIHYTKLYDEQEANTVVTVLQKGYLIADRVLRPALVMVAKGKS